MWTFILIVVSVFAMFIAFGAAMLAEERRTSDWLFVAIGLGTVALALAFTAGMVQ